MNFTAPASSLTGGGCSARSNSKVAVTLEKFFFRGSVQPGKQQSVALSYSNKRQRTGCAAAEVAKEIRPRRTKLHITECFPVSHFSSCSPTQEGSQQAAAAAAPQCHRTTPDHPLQEQDVRPGAPAKTAHEERHNSSECVEGLHDREADCGEVDENDEIKEDKSRDSAGVASASGMCNRAANGGVGRAANTATTGTAAAECTLGTKEESIAGGVQRENTSVAEPAAAARADTEVHSEGKAQREVMISRQQGVKESTILYNVLQPTEPDAGKSAPYSTEADNATATTDTVMGRTSPARAAQAQGTAPSPTAAVPGKPRAGASAKAAVATSFLTTKRASPVATACAEGDVLRPIPVSTPLVPPVDPEGKPLADVVELQRRWRNALGDCWYEELNRELTLPYFVECLAFVRKERQKYRVFPPAHLLFNAFRTTPLDKVKVVIVGQDPYHQVGQAMGLAFSVPRGIPVPPSLQNIFKEIGRNYPSQDRLDGNGKPLKAQHGDLTEWAKQGVFLMNTVLTVRENAPLSHKSAGWEKFTNRVVNIINSRRDGVVFLLWGKPAQKKSLSLDRQRHLVLEAGHPSPLSVRFFEGCQHFRKCNEYLLSKGKGQIVFGPGV